MALNKQRSAWADRTDLIIELRVVGPELRVYIALLDEIGTTTLAGFYERLPCLRETSPVPFIERNKDVIRAVFNYAIDNGRLQPIRRLAGSESPTAAAARALRFCASRCKEAVTSLNFGVIELRASERLWQMRASRPGEIFREMEAAVFDYTKEWHDLAAQVRAAHNYYRKKP